MCGIGKNLRVPHFGSDSNIVYQNNFHHNRQRWVNSLNINYTIFIYVPTNKHPLENLLAEGKQCVAVYFRAQQIIGST